MKRIIILGAPGSGKGSQCKWITKDYNVPHISTGDIFRKNISGFDWDVCKTENHVVYCRERRSVNHETVEVWAEIKREANLCNAF